MKAQIVAIRIGKQTIAIKVPLAKNEIAIVCKTYGCIRINGRKLEKV